MRQALLASFLSVAMFPCFALADNIFASMGTNSGNQNFAGPLGDNFTVGASPILVTGLGVFDSGNNGITTTSMSPINAYLYDATTKTALLTEDNYTNATSVADLAAGYRFRAESIVLSPGFHGTIVAEGYGSGESEGNSNVSAIPIVFSTDDVTFTGGIYGSTEGIYPNSGSGTYSFAAGNFTFVVVPEPASIVLGGLGALGLFCAVRLRRGLGAFDPQSRPRRD